MLETPLIEFHIPAPDEIVDLAMADGAIVRLRRYSRPGAPRLVLSHGNGLAIDAYADFWLPLTSRFDVVIFDIRNHGRNPLHDPACHTWPAIIADFSIVTRGITRHFGEATTIGVFHSLAAIAALDHALAEPAFWNALVLFDPPIYPKDGHPLQAEEDADMRDLVTRTLRRPEAYPSPQTLAAAFARRDIQRLWNPGGYMLLARATLRQTADADWALCCPRDLEARIYATKTDASLWPRMAALAMPAILIASDPDVPRATPSARTCRAVHEDLGIAYAMIAGSTHFLQIEKPEACRAAMLDFLAEHGFL